MSTDQITSSLKTEVNLDAAADQEKAQGNRKLLSLVDDHLLRAVEIGASLATIKAHKVYLPYSSFLELCQGQFGISDTVADRYINLHEVTSQQQ